MKQYKTVNNLVGWITFLIAATVYCMTIEPTASFWDCPEFITTGYKLEVGHPPGAPFFMLVANLFSQFASDASTVAKMVNYMSALMSGACILFLFWSITHLVRKLVVTDENNITRGQMVTIMGSGLVGALAYTFSDTFWFSAVEGEVYAFSSLFTAVVFWLILKWEDVANEPHSDRWLILIAYLTGLSIGVHLLNLLCLPAIVLVYYYKKVPNANARGSLLALLASGILVAAVLYGIVPGIVKVGGWFELLFVNTLGMSFNTGVIVYIILLAACLIWGIYESYTERNKARMALSFILTIAMLGIPFYGHGTSSVVIGVIVIAALWLYLRPKTQAAVKEKLRVSARTLNTSLLCTMMIVIGYSSYALIVIRSTANTPMDQNSPEDIFTLGEYLGREQYGTRPLFYGPAFTSQVALDVKDGYCEPRIKYNGTKFIRKEKATPEEKDSYIEIPGRIEYEYAQNMLFPRMYSSAHTQQYQAWQDIKGYDVPYDKCGNMIMVNMPTQWENIKFFFSYQLNWMYWRYFMWNFAGRQNDIQGNGEPHLGNWISGIPVIDNARLGDQSALPDEYGKGNKGHNVFYMLPLLLGLIGLIYQALYNHRTNPMRGIQQFWVVFFLFFMTGIAIVLYLNQTPGQPRERDYAFAGSFYAFAMWIGFGVPAIGIMLRNLLAGKKKEPSKGVTVATTALACAVGLAVPLQMVSQTWDDHDRSGRYTTRDFGFNYLASVDKDGIIFTNGDNDTFPLWYAQEVEGFRTDVRVVNLSYLTTDWYANQMQYPTSGADAIPMTVKPQNYAYENLAYSFIVPQNQEEVPAVQALEELYSSDPRRYGAPILTSPKIVMAVDSAMVSQRYSTGDVSLDSMFIAPQIGDVRSDISRLGSGLNQSKVLSLDMLANSIADNWQRPVYFATTVPTSYYLGLTPYLSATGMAYEMTPFRDPDYNVTAEKGYRNVITDFRWGGLDQPGAENLYLDETVRRMVSSIRSGIYTIAENLMMTPMVRATDESKKAAAAAGLEVPETRADMARQLLDIMAEKLPASVARYDGMLGLYFARTYLDLYMLTGNAEDLRKASELATAEADRYAQLVKYATTLDPVTLSQLGRSETYGLQYLGEALALRNRADILAAKPEILTDPEYADTLKLLQNISFESDLRTAPLIFVNGYTKDELVGSLDKLPENSDKNVMYAAIALLQANELAGVQPDAVARELMDKYGFTGAQWNHVID